MIVYGRNPVREALAGSRRRVLEVRACGPAAREPWLARAPGLRTVSSPGELERWCGSAEHQGVAAACEPYPYVDVESLLRRPASLLVALDELQDPHNLGAVCRSAECAGADGVILCRRRAAEVTPAVCKASAGAVEHLPIARVGNMSDFLKAAKARGFWCYGAAAGARTDYRQPDYAGSVLVVLGAEGRGLRRLVAEGCDQLVSLPLRGRIESLNISVAAAVLLYEVVQQREGLDSTP
ncbi:MAG: 23S rRNA (guanosine(2251)-2'-O)-methyltransferase RlmB [Solirubrobacteraceae bacterium]